jgi:uncharacterized lipoprotein YddW (UPF0748 family)/putative cell wall-binding protein
MDVFGRAWVGAVLVAVLLSGLPAAAADDDPACASLPSAQHPVTRLAGADRFATAACVAEFAFPDGADTVLLARGDAAGGYADALAGAVLAAALDAPILLTAPHTLPASTRAEIVRLAPQTAIVLGGTGAVSGAVVEAVEALGPEVERVAGKSRHATAAAVSERAGASGTAFVVNGFRPADALVAAAPAARAEAGLLLVDTDRIPGDTGAALAGFDDVVLVGGYGVISERVEAELRAGGRAVRRVSGGDRSGTAAAVARAFPSEGSVHLVAGDDRSLVDAVTAGWFAARPGGGPVLYTHRDRPGLLTDRWLRTGGLAGSPPAVLLGGEAVISAALVARLEERYAEAAAGGPPPQTRGVWVHLFDGALKSRPAIDAMLNAVAAANLNTVIVEVSRRQDAYYGSAVLPRTPDPALPADLDIIERIVPAAHERGLSVHAWVPALPAYHQVYDGLALPPDHVWVRHGPASADPWVTRDRAGAWEQYLDPGVPAVQDHVAAVYAELAGLGVDAVHTDYLRYPGRAWGYHPTSLARFQRLTGRHDVPASDDPAWSVWRRRQTTDLARRIYLDVAEADFRVGVSMAASTMGPGPSATTPYEATRTYSDVFQDWPAWLTEGAVDQAIPMNYFREATHASWLDHWVAFERGIGDGRLLAVGLGAYLNPTSSTLAQLSRTANAREGFVIYSYQQNAAAPEGQHALLPRLAAMFPDPAPPPPMPGRAAPTAGHVRVVADDGVLVTAQPVGGGQSRSVAADGTGRAAMLHLPPGAWSVTAPGHAPAATVVQAGEVSEVHLERVP